MSESERAKEDLLRLGAAGARSCSEQRLVVLVERGSAAPGAVPGAGRATAFGNARQGWGVLGRGSKVCGERVSGERLLGERAFGVRVLGEIVSGERI